MGAAAAGIGSVAAPIAGSLIGNAAAGGDQDQANASQAAALAALQGVSLPSIDELQVALQKYQSAGNLDPTLASTVNLGNSNLGGIQTDPRLKNAQLAALAQMQQIGHGGLSAQDKAALGQINRQSAQDAEAKQQQILQSMQERGAGGSGAELAARLQGAQAGADRSNQQSLSLAGQSQAAALQALMNAGTMGGQLRQQDYDQAANAAKANDLIAQFNAQNQQSVINSNTGIKNNSQLYNLQNAQNIMNANTGITNQQEMYNKQQIQQDLNNRMNKAQGIAGQDQWQTGQFNNRAQATRNLWNGIGQGVGKGLGGAAGSGNVGSMSPGAAGAATPPTPPAP